MGYPIASVLLTRSNSVLLSKSKFISGLQCLRKLWLEVYRPELTVTDPMREALFAQGQRVDVAARTRFPGGVMVEAAYFEHDIACAKTAALLADTRVPAIFQAAFLYDGVRIRVDVLARGQDGWRLIEVKSAASTKPNHAYDLAVQHYVVAGAGVPLLSDHVLRINSQYRYDGLRLDPQELFALDDATLPVAEIVGDVPNTLAMQRMVLASEEEPVVDPGTHCTSPWECPFLAHCGAVKLKTWVGRLPGIGPRRAEGWAKAGIEDVSDIPDTMPLSLLQRRAVEAMRNEECWVSPRLHAELSQIEEPVYFLDFETIGPAIPRYAGTRPYENLPVQWSLHILDGATEVRHLEYLHDTPTDPRQAVAENLLAAIGPKGTILAYNASFECQVMAQLAAYAPELAERLCALLDRTVDLLAVVRTTYYHPEFLGSFSLKSVAPALVPDAAYDDLAIQEGGIASAEYERMLECDDPSERARIRQNLLDYCQRDTWAMVRVWQELKQLTKPD